MNKVREITYADLARECKQRGDIAGVWRCFKQHARVHRKLREQRKALTVCDTVKGS